MHALTFSRFGGPEVLEWSDVPDPHTAPNVAVVRTRAIGLNFADIYRRQGRYHLAGSPPWIAGYEGAGVIARSIPRMLAVRSPSGSVSRSPIARSPMPNWWRCRWIG